MERAVKLLNVLLDLLFPPKCPFCRKVQDVPGICPACLKDLPWTDEARGLRELEPGLRRRGFSRPGENGEIAGEKAKE